MFNKTTSERMPSRAVSIRSPHIWISETQMKTSLARAIALLIAFAMPQSPASETQSKSSDPVPAVPLPKGLIPIFDGKSLDGWSQIPADAWTVKDGALASLGAGRGIIHTNKSFARYRIVFDMRHISGQPDHQACVLVFCATPSEGQKPPDALAGIQFQVPNGGH